MVINTEIKKGYKKTELGVIPEDWDVKKLGDILKVKHGKGQKEVEDINGQYPIFGTGGLMGYANNFLYDKPSVLIGRKGTIDEPRFMSTPFWTVDTLFYTEVFKDCSPKFLFYKFLQIHWYSYNEASGVPSLNAKTIENIKLTLPSLFEEQTNIATVLSDADALIENLEKLIAKKKAIKQGAMQELLTGKRRLSGFSGEWKRKKLGDLGDITGSGVDKKIRPEEVSVRLLNFLDVFHKDFLFTKNLNHQVTARSDQLERCSVKKGDVFFTPSSEMPFDIGISAVAMEDMENVVYSYHIDRFRLLEDWDLFFRAYIFQTKDFSNQTATQCEGSGKRYVLNLTTFRERLSVYYPTDKNEQKVIGKILFDMDSELEKLELELTKYQNLKQGMMQVLLTGKIRLI